MFPDIQVGAAWIEALAAQDFEKLQSLLAPDVRFRALIPPGQREDATAADVAARVGGWFGDADPLELVDSEVGRFAGRLHMSYRFDAFEEGRWHAVEQQAYFDVQEGRITAMDLLCSGFRPI